MVKLTVKGLPSLDDAKQRLAVSAYSGFVAGAPMKIVGKGVQKGLMMAARPALKKLGKRSADEVISVARKIGKDGEYQRSRENYY